MRREDIVTAPLTRLPESCEEPMGFILMRLGEGCAVAALLVAIVFLRCTLWFARNSTQPFRKQ
jgi:hypothetical protein